MKTLDDAVVELGGVWPSMIDYMTKFEGKNDWRCTRSPENGLYICAREQFQQRAKELGFVNGYRWGIEYATNGKMPDLADDVKVSCEFKSHNIYEYTAIDAEEVNWMDVVSFKITDQRYKPEDTSYLVSEIPESKQKAENVSVDEIAMAKKEFACLSPMLQDLMQESFDKVIARMEENRKAEAEKKRVVQQASFKVSEFRSLDKVLGELYDAGYLRSPANKD
jgi:hypothetical protein